MPVWQIGILKLPCNPGIPSPEVITIIPFAMFFTKNGRMPERLVEAVSERERERERERAFRCCYSSHSSVDELFDFLSSL